MKFLDDRQSERYEVNEGKVLLRVLFTKSHDLKEVQTQVQDLGVGGLSLAPGVDLEEGSLADLKIQLDGLTLQNTLGLVRWCSDEHGVGIEFFYGSEEEREKLESRIEEWVKEKEEEAG